MCVFWLLYAIHCGLPWWLISKEFPEMQETQEMWVNPWARKIPWRWKWQPTPVFLPGKSHEQRSLVGYNLWGSQKRRTWLSDKQQHNIHYSILITKSFTSIHHHTIDSLYSFNLCVPLFLFLKTFYFVLGCWEGLGAGGEGDDRGCNGWMASLTQWTWVWVNSGSW